MNTKQQSSNINFLKLGDVNTHLIKDFLPIALTSTIVAPLTRVKTILQTMNLISINEKYKTFKKFTRIKDFLHFIEGIWQMYTDYLFKKFLNKFSNTLHPLTSAIISSSIGILVSYPFEVAYTRLASDMTRQGNKRIYSSLTDMIYKDVKYSDGSKFKFFNFYKGLNISIVSNIIHSSCNLYMVNVMTKNRSKIDIYTGSSEKIIKIFGVTTLSSIILSLPLYPLETLKKQLQVNGSFGFMKQFKGTLDAIVFYSKRDKLLCLYRGYSVHLLRAVPLHFIQYCSYASLLDYFNVR